MRTRGSDYAEPSHVGDDVPNPPQMPPNLAEAVVALVNATTENTCLMREMAQNNLHAPQSNHG